MAIQKIRLPNGQSFNLEEWLHWASFSVVEGAAGANVNLRAFSYVVGDRVPQAGAVPGGSRSATESDTNWVTKSRVNHDEAVVVFAITNEVFAIEGSNAPIDSQNSQVAATAPIFTGTNLRWLQLLLMEEFFVGANISKPMASAPFEYYGQGIGAVAYSSGDSLDISIGGPTSLNLNYGTAGEINPIRNQRRWAMPVMVHSDRVMYVKFTTPGGSLTEVDQAWRIRVYLDGIKRRPVA
jgi:hypothetical protein